MRFSPSGQCCIVTCEIADLLTASSVCSGSWTDIGDPRVGVTTTSSNALIYFTKAARAGRPWRVTGEFALTIPDPDDYDFTIRFIAGLTDCNDFICFEYHHSFNAATEELCIQWRIIKNINGTETIVSKHPFNECNEWNADQFTALSDWFICYNGEYITAGFSFPDSPNRHIATRDSDALTIAGNGGKVGFATGSLTGVDDATFTSLHFEYMQTDSRPDCQTCDEHCCKGAVPEEVTLEIDGADAGYVENEVGEGPGGLRVLKSLFEGTRVLSIIPDPTDVLTPYNPEYGDAFGSWYVKEAVASGDGIQRWNHSTLAWEDCEGTLVFSVGCLGGVSLEAQDEFDTGNEVDIAYSIDTGEIEEMPPCENWTNWIDALVWSDVLSDGDEPGFTTVRFKRVV